MRRSFIEPCIIIVCYYCSHNDILKNLCFNVWKSGEAVGEASFFFLGEGASSSAYLMRAVAPEASDATLGSNCCCRRCAWCCCCVLLSCGGTSSGGESCRFLSNSPFPIVSCDVGCAPLRTYYFSCASSAFAFDVICRSLFQELRV